MARPHRFAAGAIVIRNGSILLVQYRPRTGSYLVAPGGGVQESETLEAAAVRETFEETGVTVAAGRLLAVEDLYAPPHFRMCKFWYLCEAVAGEPRATEGARHEGITHSGWFSREQLAGETVYPRIVLEHAWEAFASPGWRVRTLPLREIGI
jgi:8-oxo-dGTP diphosphatase